MATPKHMISHLDWSVQTSLDLSHSFPVSASQDYNDVPATVHQPSLDRLLASGVDQLLATHVAQLFVCLGALKWEICTYNYREIWRISEAMEVMEVFWENPQMDDFQLPCLNTGGYLHMLLRNISHLTFIFSRALRDSLWEELQTCVLFHPCDGQVRSRRIPLLDRWLWEKMLGTLPILHHFSRIELGT